MNQIKNLLTAGARNEQVLSEHSDVELQKDFSLSFLMLAEVDHQVSRRDMHEQARDLKQGHASHLTDFFFCCFFVLVR